MSKVFDLNELITSEQCAAWLGISLQQLRDHVKAKRIPAVLVAGDDPAFYPRQVIQSLYKTHQP